MPHLASSLTTTQGIAWLAALVVGELAILILATVAINLIVGAIMRKIANATKSEEIKKRVDGLHRRVRMGTIIACVLLCLAVLGYDGWLMWQGLDPTTYTLELLAKVSPEAWVALAAATGKIILASFGALIAARMVRAALTKVEAKAVDWEHLRSNGPSLKVFFGGLKNAIANFLWLLVLVFAFDQLQIPDAFSSRLYAGINIYLIIAVGLAIVRATAVIAETFDAFGHKYAQSKDWVSYYDHLRPLIPLFRRCLESAAWIGVVTLVVTQLRLIAVIAVYGPRLIMGVGIFFASRVVVEFGNLFIEGSMLGKPNLDETERRRRTTIVPLIKTVFQWVAYFIAFVMVLAAIGLDPMPYLAGAGVLGVVIGFGAQPMINDVVSGFFILFENIYLVGDFIVGGEAKGTVESIDFRTTRIRDPDGRLHIVRNGDMKPVINYSKGFVNAVVRVNVAYDTEVGKVVRVLQECGRRLKEIDPNVAEPTTVSGVEAFNDFNMTIHTSTRCKPACHFDVGNHLRQLIKEAFEREGISIPLLQRVATIKHDDGAAAEGAVGGAD